MTPKQLEERFQDLERQVARFTAQHAAHVAEIIAAAHQSQAAGEGI